MKVYIITTVIDGMTTLHPFTVPKNTNVMTGDFNEQSGIDDPETEEELFRIMESVGIETGWGSELDSVSIGTIDTANIPHIFI